jgi:hypothetical protein
MSTITRLSLPPRSPAIGAGHELAIEMFDELTGCPGDEADQAMLDGEYRRGLPYRDVLADYLKRAREAGVEVERGFTMILSDLVAQVMNGNGPSAFDYAQLMRRGVIADGPRQAARRKRARELRQTRRERRVGAAVRGGKK